MNTTPTRSGQINKIGDAFALFLKKFGGEILTEFEVTQVTKALHTILTIANGKSAQFPVAGRATAKYHVPGEDLLDPSKGYLSQIGMNERTIYIDDVLIATTFVPSIDEVIQHYDVRSIYATELGRALAYAFDKNVLQTGVLAARGSAAVTGGPAGKVIKAGSTIVSDADVLVEAIKAAAKEMDKKNVPKAGRSCVLRPDEYWLLINNHKAMNRDFGGSGSIASGKIYEVAGVQIVESNHLPSTDLGATQDDGVRNTYKADFTDTVGLVMSPEAVGTLRLIDIAVESAYIAQNQGHLLIAKYAMGHGILRPECAVELSKASS